MNLFAIKSTCALFVQSTFCQILEANVQEKGHAPWPLGVATREENGNPQPRTK